MKKIILFICLMMPLASFGQKQTSRERWYQERDQKRAEIMNRNSGDYLQMSSKSLLISTTLSVAGGVAAGLSTVLSEDYDTQKSIAYIGAATSLVGLIVTIKGYVEIGKAGKKLKYEVGAGRAGLAFNW